MEGHHSTEWALLFPLRTGLFSMKSSTVTRSVERIKKKNPAKYVAATGDTRMRRGSSLSDLDKLSANTLRDLVRSTTANQQLSASSASVPHSPYLSRSYLSSNTASVRGSIGDLMNQKIHGSSQWSVRSETLIAKTVPLSTVTPRQSPPLQYVEVDKGKEDLLDEAASGPLTVAQRTQRLSRLIKQQRNSLNHHRYTVCLPH